MTFLSDILSDILSGILSDILFFTVPPADTCLLADTGRT